MTEILKGVSQLEWNEAEISQQELLSAIDQWFFDSDEELKLLWQELNNPKMDALVKSFMDALEAGRWNEDIDELYFPFSEYFQVNDRPFLPPN